MATIQEIFHVYDQYVECWRPLSREHREETLSKILAKDAIYLTPNHDGGAQEMLDDMEGFQQNFPGGHFVIDDVSFHHNAALLTWVLIQPDGARGAKGHDHVLLAPDGRIANITTYSSPVPRP